MLTWDAKNLKNGYRYVGTNTGVYEFHSVTVGIPVIDETLQVLWLRKSKHGKYVAITKGGCIVGNILISRTCFS